MALSIVADIERERLRRQQKKAPGFAVGGPGGATSVPQPQAPAAPGPSGISETAYQAKVANDQYRAGFEDMMRRRNLASQGRSPQYVEEAQRLAAMRRNAGALQAGSVPGAAPAAARYAGTVADGLRAASEYERDLLRAGRGSMVTEAGKAPIARVDAESVAGLRGAEAGRMTAQAQDIAAARAMEGRKLDAAMTEAERDYMLRQRLSEAEIAERAMRTGFEGKKLDADIRFGERDLGVREQLSQAEIAERNRRTSLLGLPPARTPEQEELDRAAAARAGIENEMLRAQANRAKTDLASGINPQRMGERAEVARGAREMFGINEEWQANIENDIAELEEGMSDLSSGKVAGGTWGGAEGFTKKTQDILGRITQLERMASESPDAAAYAADIASRLITRLPTPGSNGEYRSGFLGGEVSGARPFSMLPGQRRSREQFAAGLNAILQKANRIKAMGAPRQ